MLIKLCFPSTFYNHSKSILVCKCRFTYVPCSWMLAISFGTWKIVTSIMLFDYIKTYHYMFFHLHPKYNHHYMNRKDYPKRSYITENSWNTHRQLLKESIKYNLYIHSLQEFYVCGCDCQWDKNLNDIWMTCRHH